VYLLDTMIGTMWVIVYTHLQGGIHNYQRSTFVHTSALNFSVINKPMSEREVNKIYSELTTTVGAFATTGLMICNLSIGPYSCYDGINPFIRYTER